MNKAFTALEVMLAVTLLAIGISFAVLYTQTSPLRADLHSLASTFVSYGRVAQSDAAAGRNNQSHGIHVEASSYTIFEGTAYNAADPANFTIDMPSTITLQNVALNGGGQDILFSPPHGETATYGSLEFFSSTLNQTVPITISPLGAIEY